MITTYDENPKFWQRTWFLALVIGAAAGAGVWWWQARNVGPDEGVKPQAAAKTAAPARSSEPTVDSALLVPPSVGQDGRPSDFEPEEWAALKDAMAQTPNPRAELERVVKYLRFQKAFEQWQSLQEGPDVATRRKLAEKLLQQVPERLAQAEVTYGEAAMLQAALLADIEPNEGLRQQRIEQAQAQLKAASPQSSPEEQERERRLRDEYERQQNVIVRAYQAQPENQRDPARLARDLDAARIAVYGSKK